MKTVSMKYGEERNAHLAGHSTRKKITKNTKEVDTSNEVDISNARPYTPVFNIDRENGSLTHSFLVWMLGRRLLIEKLNEK